jgi:hypothetical protein
MVSWSQPFILTLTRKVLGVLRSVFDLHMLKALLKAKVLGDCGGDFWLRVGRVDFGV